MTWLTVTEYLCHKWLRICSTCRKRFPVLSFSWLITGFVTRVTRRVVPQVDVELLTIPEHLSTLPVYCGVRFARSLVFCVVFCRSLFVLFLFGHCGVCTSLSYGFWMSLWHLQALLNIIRMWCLPPQNAVIIRRHHRFTTSKCFNNKMKLPMHAY